MTHILFIGDSLISNYNWQKRMPQLTVETSDAPGATVQNILDLMPHNKVEKVPDLVLIMVGTNDLYMQDYDFCKPLKGIIQACNKQFPLAEILLTNMFPLQIDHVPSSAIETVNQNIKELATSTGCCLLDMHKQFLPRAPETIFKEDKIHLTDLGYEIWCRNILQHIAFLIESD